MSYCCAEFPSSAMNPAHQIVASAEEFDKQISCKWYPKEIREYCKTLRTEWIEFFAKKTDANVVVRKLSVTSTETLVSI